jgi:hypothetical protein
MGALEVSPPSEKRRFGGNARFRARTSVLVATSLPAGSFPEMSTRLYAAVLTALAVACIALTGCGDSSKASSAASTRPSTTRSTPSPEPGRSRHETRADIVAAVATCKHGIDTGTWLPGSSKTPLYKTCEQGLKRGLTEIRLYALETCNEVAFTSAAKSEAEKHRVFETCYQPSKVATKKIEG